MISINLRLNLPVTTLDQGSVITVYYKNRTNIIGTCTVSQNESGTVGLFQVEEELHGGLYVLYLYGAINENIILDGILLDDAPHNKSISAVGSLQLT